jgi:hypothetical protein
VTPPLPDLVLYARPGCGLCDEARATLELRAFAFTIPVVELGDQRLELATSPAKLRRLLDDVLEGVDAAP